MAWTVVWLGLRANRLGLLTGLEQLLHVVGGEPQQSAKLLGQFAGIASGKGILRKTGAACDELSKSCPCVAVRMCCSHQRPTPERTRAALSASPVPGRRRRRHRDGLGLRRGRRRWPLRPTVVPGFSDGRSLMDGRTRLCRARRALRHWRGHVGRPIEKIRPNRSRIARPLQLLGVDGIGGLRPRVPEIIVARLQLAAARPRWIRRSPRPASRRSHIGR